MCLRYCLSPTLPLKQVLRYMYDRSQIRTFIFKKTDLISTIEKQLGSIVDCQKLGKSNPIAIAFFGWKFICDHGHRSISRIPDLHTLAATTSNGNLSWTLLSVTIQAHFLTDLFGLSLHPSVSSWATSLDIDA